MTINCTTRMGANLVLATACVALSACRKPAAAPTIVTYRTVAPPSPAGDMGGAIDPQLTLMLLNEVEQRLGDDGEVYDLGGGKIAVHINGDADAQRLDEIKRRVSAPGELPLLLEEVDAAAEPEREGATREEAVPNAEAPVEPPPEVEPDPAALP